jgi:hypothetical protein
MYGPPVVAWLLVALSVATATTCVLRGGARAEALLGAGMAVMAVPLSVFEPPRWGPAALALVFTAAALHALLPSRHRAMHRGHHSVCAGAMAYMAAAMAGTAPATAHPDHAGHHGAGGGAPLLTGLLLAYFAAYVLRSGARLVASADPAAVRPVPGGAIRLWHAPEVAAASRAAMAMAMFAMLLTL